MRNFNHKNKMLRCLALLAAFGILLPGQARAKADAPPVVMQAAPPFTLPDIAGKAHTLQEFRTRPVVLFFFCGCDPCHAAARLWAQGQQGIMQDAQGRALPAAQTPRTVIVFTGDAENARVFAAETGLPADTVLLTDPEMKVADAYHASPCPRALVIDAGGVIRYSSLGDDAKNIVPATLISRIVSALPAVVGPQSVSGLSVSEGNSVEKIMERTGPDAVKCDLGEINPARTPHCEHDFTLKNTTDAPLIIGRVRGSCGCESVTLRRDKQELTQATLAPGEQITLHVSIKMQGQHGEHLHKFVWVDGADSKPLTTLALELSVHETVSFSTGFLAFGSVPKGTERTVDFAVTVEKDALTQGKLPRLVSSNSALRVATVGIAAPAIWNGRPAVTQNYRVSPADAKQLASLEGILHFDLPAVAVKTTSGTAPHTAADEAAVNAEALRNASVPVSGEVVGSVVALPRTLLFGSVEAGKENRRSVMLTGLSAEALQKMTVSCDNKWVTARVQVARENITPPTCLLEITLSRTTPPGIMQATITLNSPQGEKELVLPVVAEITGAK